MAGFTAEVVAQELARVRAACLGLPETSERVSHGGPAFFVNRRFSPGVEGGRPPLARDTVGFVMFLDDHHGDGHLAIWCAAPPGIQEQLVEQEPARFFRPPYVGHRGWLGVELSVDPDWDEVAAICADAYRQVAPKTLVAALDARADSRP